MRRFLLVFALTEAILTTEPLYMAYQKVPRPANAVPDEVAWKSLGLSRATFFRKLKEGAVSAPVQRGGTARRWWTPSDIEVAHQELSTAGQERSSSRPRRRA